MTKNKKKLRRAERRYSVSRTAQTLVLTGLLLAGGVGTALAAELTAGSDWDAATATATPQILVGNATASNTTSANITGNLTTLTITGDTIAATLNAKHDLTFAGAVSMQGAAGFLGSLTIDSGKTFTSKVKTTVGDYGKLAINGTHAGLLEATGANSSAIDLAGTQKGDVLLNGAGASLTSTDNAAKVQGDVTVNKGTISTATGNLTIDGTLELKDANAVFTATASKTLEVGTLKLGTNVVVDAGTLSITSGLETTQTTSLTLNTGGIIHYKGVDARLDTWTSGLLLGTGGTLTVDKTLVMDGFNIKATKGAAGSSTTITAAALELDRKGTIGADDRGNHTMTINATADTAFLSGGDLTLVGATSNVTTLNLNGISSSDSNIILAGQTDGGAILNVGKNAQGSPTTISMGTLTVGTVAPGPHGTVLIQGANAKLSILSVNNLNIGTNGKVNLGAFGVLNINNDFTIADNKIGANSVAGGIQVVADSALHVRGTLTLTPNGGVGTGVSAGVAPSVAPGVSNPGTVVADVVKAGASGTEKLTWTGGSLTLLGDGAGKFLEASELEITGNGVNLGMVNDAPAIQGGTFANKVTMTGGKLHVNKGEWTLSNTVDGLKVDATSSVEVIGGTLNVAKWTSTVTANSVAANVTGGTLNLTGDVATNAGNIKASAGGVVTALGSKVIHSDFTKTVGGVGTFEVQDTGVLKIKTSAKSMTLTEYGALKTAIMTGTGTLRLDGVTIKDITESTTIKMVDGVSVAGNVVAVADGNTVNNFGTEVKGLKGAGSADIGLTVNGGLTLVGGNSADFKLSDNGSKNTNITVTGANNQLNLGSAAGAATVGTLKGNVTLSDNAAKLNATNGTFTVAGDISTGTGAATINVNSGNLNVGKLITSGNDSVAIKNGSLNVTELVAKKGDIVSVGSNTTVGTLTVNKVTLNGANLFLDPSWIEGTEFQDAGTASRAAITAFSAGIDGDLIVGQNSQLSLGTKDVAQLTAAIGQMGNVWGKSGITAALGIYGPQTLAATNGSITVDGSLTAMSTSTANSATFADKSLLVVSAADVGSGVALTGTNSKLTVASGAKLHILGGKNGDTVNIVAGFKDSSSTMGADGWKGANLTTDTGLLSAAADPAYTPTNGAYSVILSQQSSTTVFPMLSTNMTGFLDAMVATTGVDSMSENTGVRFMSRAVSDSYIGANNPTLAAATIEGAAQLAVVGAVPAMTISAANAATNAVNTRTSFATPLMDTTKAVALHQGTDGALSLDSGLSAGSSMKTGLGVWIMPLYQSNKVWGMKGENFNSGYSSDLGGVALGADYTINDALRFGLAFNLGGGYAKSSGDFSATDNSFNFWGLSLYGGWTQNNFGLSGDVGYTSTYNKVKQETPTAMQMGDIKSDVTSHAWTAGLRGEYKFATEALDIIPHVGVRYLGLTTDSYKAKIAGGTVFKADEAYQSIWSFPVGVTLSKEITNASGWTFRPQVDLGITPAAGDVKAKSRVRIPNVDGSAEMKMQVVDYMSYDGGVGLEVKKDNVSFGINYNIQASEHRTGHGVFGTLRYEF